MHTAKIAGGLLFGSEAGGSKILAPARIIFENTQNMGQNYENIVQKRRFSVIFALKPKIV